VSETQSSPIVFPLPLDLVALFLARGAPEHDGAADRAARRESA